MDNSFTIKCKYVYKRQDGTWNRCRKMNKCRFAHSKEQLQYLLCNLDTKCNMFSNNGICMYKHSKETKEEWYNRTKMFRAELPETNNTLYYEKELDKPMTKIPIDSNIPTELEYIESIGQFIRKKIT